MTTECDETRRVKETETPLFFEGLIERALYYEEMDRTERKLTFSQTKIVSESGFPIHG